ncbi:hypothetical protein LTS08_003847 [Lithohypha guttulata]|nr:hypothetical protein LTS08_003847 [Lithohypha guttulata]
MGPKKSMSAVYADGGGRNHRRVKSGTTTPLASPRSHTSGGGHMKRNASHVVLPKNRSHGNLRKNQSTNALTALNRNISRGALNKLGAPTSQKVKKDAQQKQGVFDMGNASDDNEEEAEWEDSTASPELTRNNSKVSTPQRSHTPNAEPIQKPPDVSQDIVPERTSSPPSPEVLKTNRSAPNLRREQTLSHDRDHERQPPALVQQQNGRGSRAPPAMTTANAISSQQHLPRTDSQRSLGQSSFASLDVSQDHNEKTIRSPGLTNQSSSGSAVVSHFLTQDNSKSQVFQSQDGTTSDNESESQSVADFMATYKPQPSESPEQPRMNINKARVASQPSRTQQKLELQRRKAMHGAGPPTPVGGLALSAGSSVSLHSRTHSHGKGVGRTKSMVVEMKAIKQDYEASVKQLTVIRRFRNPVLESLHRLRHTGSLPIETPKAGHLPSKTNAEQHKRPPSRHGNRSGVAAHDASEANHAQRNAPPRIPTTQTDPESTRATTAPRASKVSFAAAPHTQAQPRPGGARDSKVTFQLSRQESQDDILIASPDRSGPVGGDEYSDGLSPEEALIRRMWESRIHVA